MLTSSAWSLDQRNGRYAVRFGSQKFNIHTRKAEFLPAAEHPTYGSLDLCLILDGSLDKAKAEIERKGYPIEPRASATAWRVRRNAEHLPQRPRRESRRASRNITSEAGILL